MKSKYFAIIGGSALFIWFLWQVFDPPQNPDPNIYYFEGRITNIIKSNNHDFGIIEIQLDTVYIRVKDSSFLRPNDKHFPPFQYHGKIGEAYCSIPLESIANAVGYKIVSDTISNTINIINGENDTVGATDIFSILEPSYRKFIMDNTKLK